MNLYPIEYVNLRDPRSVQEVRTFLQRFELTYQADDVEFTLVLRDNDNIIATGSFNGSVLRNFAVDPGYQGEGLTALVISELIQELARRGRFHYFVYTKPDTAWMFADLGLREIVSGQHAVLLEGGITNIRQYLTEIKQHVAHLPAPRAALVMNCNPFTLGHRYLIEKAAKENPGVIVFVVSEDSSTFPFADRLALVKAGTADLANVAIVKTGPYQVSKATFPTYFTKAEHQQQASTELDVKLFGQQIAPALSITRRYIGDEPYCPVTAAYNLTMQQLLPNLGIEVMLVPRKMNSNQAISASQVRARIRSGDLAGIKSLVPTTTFDYLQAPKNQVVIERLKSSEDKRH